MLLLVYLGALPSVLSNLASSIPEIKITVDARADGRVKNILERKPVDIRITD